MKKLFKNPFSLKHGTALAEFQDELFNNPKMGMLDEIRKKNLWVWLSCYIAPNNLAIRHLILQYNYNDDKYNKKHYKRNQAKLKKIRTVFNKLLLDAGNGYKLWAEGYSYWLYIRDFILAHEDEELTKTAGLIENGFYATGYWFNGVRFPAPFGDCRLCSIDLARVTDKGDPFVKTKYGDKVRISKNTYVFKPVFVGLNMHVQHKYKNLKLDKLPHNNKFYLGYKNKYPTLKSELKDMKMVIKNKLGGYYGKNWS